MFALVKEEDTTPNFKKSLCVYSFRVWPKKVYSLWVSGAWAFCCWTAWIQSV